MDNEEVTAAGGHLNPALVSDQRLTVASLAALGLEQTPAVMSAVSGNPFDLDGTRERIVRHRAWREAEDQALAALLARPGLTLVLGAPGTGKTLLLAELERRLKGMGREVRLFGPLVADDACEIGEDCLLLIDEVRANSAMLARLRASGEMRCLLAELPGFEDRLGGLPRSPVIVWLPVLAAPEARCFISSRLGQAGWSMDVLTTEALDLLVTEAAGVPRAIAMIGGHAFHLAAVEGAPKVTADHVAQAVAWAAVAQASSKAEALPPPPPPPAAEDAAGDGELEPALRLDGPDGEGFRDGDGPERALRPADRAVAAAQGSKAQGGKAQGGKAQGGRTPSRREFAIGFAVLVAGVVGLVGMAMVAAEWSERTHPEPVVAAAEPVAVPSDASRSGAAAEPSPVPSVATVELPPSAPISAPPRLLAELSPALAPMPDPGPDLAERMPAARLGPDTPTAPTAAPAAAPAAEPRPAASAPQARAELPETDLGVTTLAAPPPEIAVVAPPLPSAAVAVPAADASPAPATSAAAIPAAAAPPARPEPAAADRPASTLAVATPAEPKHVVISYPRSDRGGAAGAGVIAEQLRRIGYQAGDPIPLAHPVHAARLRIFFAEDRAEGEALRAALGENAPELELVSLPPRGSLPRPGTLELVLPAGAPVDDWSRSLDQHGGSRGGTATVAALAGELDAAEPADNATVARGRSQRTALAWADAGGNVPKYFVEVQALDGGPPHEVFSGYTSRDSVHIELDPGSRRYAWRVHAIEPAGGHYASSRWYHFDSNPAGVTPN